MCIWIRYKGELVFIISTYIHTKYELKYYQPNNVTILTYNNPNTARKIKHEFIIM